MPETTGFDTEMIDAIEPSSTVDTAEVTDADFQAVMAQIDAELQKMLQQIDAPNNMSDLEEAA